MHLRIGSFGLALVLATLCLNSNVASAGMVFDSLVGYWGAEGNANDLSGNGHHGTLQGNTSYTTGVFGQAFDVGLSDTVRIPDSDDWAFGTADFSIQAWLNFDVADSGASYTFISQGTGTETWVLRKNDDNDQKWRFFTASGGNVVTDIRRGDNSTNPTANVWHHLVLTKSSNQFRIYLDGAELTSGTVANIGNAAPIPNFAAPLLLGGSGHAGTSFDGQIDEVAIFDRGLTASEVQQLYDDPGLLASQAVPEPSSFLLAGIGILCALMARFHVRRSKCRALC